MATFFTDRRDAGRRLAKALSAWRDKEEVIVLALPRGGVPVAFEVAFFLHVALDLMLVRKLGVPGHEELAMGAIALPDIIIFNDDVVSRADVSTEGVNRVVARESAELLRRNQVYRNGASPPDLKQRIVILVDDGVATGATIQAAVEAVRRQNPLRTVVAVPVAPEDVWRKLQQLTDEVICLHRPKSFYGVGEFYEDFSQMGDQEVVFLLEQARRRGRAENGVRE